MPRPTSACRLLLAASLLATAACGDDRLPAYTVQINSMDIVLSAVDRVQVLLRASDIDKRFRSVPDESFEGALIGTRVTGAGEFLIEIERGWVTAHHRTPEAMEFALDLPLYPRVEGASPAIGDPRIEVSFVRRDQEIAVGERFLPWPLPGEERGTVSVWCRRDGTNPALDFGDECAGETPTDGGAADAGDGSTGDDASSGGDGA